MAENKRRHRRVDVNIVVNLYEPDSAEPTAQGIIKNLSAGGIGVETRGVFKENNIIQLNFYLPDGTYLRNVEGRIVWLRQKNGSYNLGVRFLDIGIRNKLRIWWYVRKRE